MAENFHPLLNAILNFCSFCCLLSGYIAIKKKNEILHKRLMICALVFSTVFLISYVTYHFQSGHTVFPDLGWVKKLYLLILVPHVILAVVMVPFILMTFYLAFKENWTRHKKIAKITFPMWSYVSVTGVIIYYMVYHLAPSLIQT